MRWAPGADWVREPSDGPLDPQIRRYLRDTTPISGVPRLDAQTLERLRALGYLDPSRDP